MHPRIARMKASVVKEKLEQLARTRCEAQSHLHLVASDFEGWCIRIGPIAAS